MQVPKYSIIVPIHNGLPYLRACLDTILTQNYDDYELIASNDHSTDGSTEFLSGLFHTKLAVVEPDESLSMMEHWEWALSHARGDWQIFVGQDDGVQNYFFRLADRLTTVAEDKGLRAIVTRRAYFYWPGCEFYYGNKRVSYVASNELSIRYTGLDAMRALLGERSYHNMPQMYTASMFHRSLLDEARERQEGRVFTCHPQDANLAVIACSLEKKYLRCEVPIGWVGSSPKSAGLAISSHEKEARMAGLKSLRNEYNNKVYGSEFKYNYLAGRFSFANTSVYFWQALLETGCLRSDRVQQILRSRIFRVALFASVLSRISKNNLSDEKRELFIEILDRNELSYGLVQVLSQFWRIALSIYKALEFVLYRVPRKIYRMVFVREIRHAVAASDAPEMDYLTVSEKISRKVEKNRLV